MLVIFDTVNSCTTDSFKNSNVLHGLASRRHIS
jgi:hypothetical protein